MNRVQKMAWWIAIWISISVVAGCTAFGVLYFTVGLPKAFAGFGFLGIAGFGGLGPSVFGKDKGKVQCDERDKAINRRAAVAGFGAAFLITGLACMAPFFLLGSKATISIVWLPNIFMAAGLTSFFVHSVAILVQYGWGDKSNE